MSQREETPELTIGRGERWGLAVVALFLAGMAVGGLAVHNFVNAHDYYLPTAAALLLMLLACALAALRTDEERDEGKG
jgi:hypothetical protein